MQTGTFLIVLGIILIIGVTLALTRRMRFQPECPHCGSKELVERNRETLASRTIEYMGSGTPAGGNIRLQLDLAVTYRCQDCGREFTRRFTETQ